MSVPLPVSVSYSILFCFRRGWCRRYNSGVVLFACLEFRILEEVHESSLVLEDVLAVSSFAGKQIVAVLDSSVFAKFRIVYQLYALVCHFEVALKTAELADSVVCAREDIEIIAVAMRASAFLTLPEVQILGARDHDMVVDDILSSFDKVSADLFHALNLIVLHDDILAPGEEIVVYNLPARGQSQHCMVSLYAASPVRTADTNNEMAFCMK